MAVYFQEHARGEAVVYGACGELWIMVLHAPPTAPDMRLSRSSLSTMVRAAPDGFPTLTWILPEAGFQMDADARKAAADATEAFHPHMRAKATVIEGDGFQAATIRAIVAGLDLLTPTRCPRKVLAALEPAVTWCLRYTASGILPSEAPAHVEALLALRDRLR